MSLDFILGLGGTVLSACMGAFIAASDARRGRTPPYLSFFFLEAALFFAGELCVAAGGPAQLSTALSYCGSLIALPSLYLYGRSTVEKPGGRAILHYLPAIANLPLGILVAILGPSIQGSPLAFLYYLALTAGQTAQLIAYGGASLRLARAYGSGGVPNWFLRVSRVAIAGYALISALGWLLIVQALVSEFLGRPVFLFPGLGSFALMAAIFLVWTICLCALWGGERGSREGREARKYGGRPMPETEARSLIDRARRLLDAEADLASPDVLPRSLAARLGVPYYLLSRAVNEAEGMSVLDLVNSRRVERAKAIIARNKEGGILDACFDSGFGSKSTFNAVFRKFVGMTPSRYRASLGSAPRRG